SPTLRWLGRLAEALEVEAVSLLKAQPARQERVLVAARGRRYETALPIYSLQAAATAFSRAHAVDEVGTVRVLSTHRDGARLFVGRVRGRSMEPLIPSGALCLFRAAPVSSPDGKVVLVELRDRADPDTGGRYTVKRLIRKARDRTLELVPENPSFRRIVIDEK